VPNATRSMGSQQSADAFVRYLSPASLVSVASTVMIVVPLVPTGCVPVASNVRLDRRLPVLNFLGSLFFRR
jgi:hypothetical protein